MLKDLYIYITAEEMRQCAIDLGWWTSGTNAQYSKWLDMAGYGHKITTAWLRKVAMMAMDNSNLDSLGYEASEDKERIIDSFSAALLEYTHIGYRTNYY